jgi:methylated-DNA-[protein]-cysteine S-methyltransferase
VGMANRNNPFAIVVPCHRVIGKSGDLTGYFYGLDTKMQLLRLENPARYPQQMQLGTDW